MDSANESKEQAAKEEEQQSLSPDAVTETRSASDLKERRLSGEREAAVVRREAEWRGKRMPFTFNPLALYRGAFRRFFTAFRHVFGLMAGGLVSYVRALPAHRRKGLRSFPARFIALLFRPFLKRDIVRLPFPQQLRRRLEILGPTYVKLGQLMAVRRDLLPASVTDELKTLFDSLPPIPFEQVRALVEEELGQPVDRLFRWIEESPLGSASIAQVHLAETMTGDKVVLKVIKPGIRDIITSDLKMLEIVGFFLQWTIPRYQPQQIIEEFSRYAIREADFSYEADHAEIFAANFADVPDVVFPDIYRDLSTRNVLTMEFLDGFKLNSAQTAALTEQERARIVDLGVSAVIRMLYRDGFFHADLHAGNLLILPGDPIRLGFIDLGMVGRFEDHMRRRILYYFHALVNGDVETASRYLLDLARVGEGGDAVGFRRAAADRSRRYLMHAGGDLSVAQLILESVGLGGRYRIFFPVETTLMVKALVTYEGVGRILDPRLDVPAVSRRHAEEVFKDEFDPRKLVRTMLRQAPEMVDLLLQLPQLASEGVKFWERSFQQPHVSPTVTGLRSGILSGACVLGGVVAVVMDASWILPTLLFLCGFLFYYFGD